MHHPTDRISHTTAFVTPVVEHWLEQENWVTSDSNYTYIHTYTHTYIHTHIHTFIHTYIHSYTHTYIHTHIHTYTYIHACIYTYIHTQTHTYTSIYPSIHLSIYLSIYIYIYIYIFFFFFSSKNAVYPFLMFREFFFFLIYLWRLLQFEVKRCILTEYLHRFDPQS